MSKDCSSPTTFCGGTAILCRPVTPAKRADNYFLSRHSLQREDSCRNPAWVWNRAGQNRKVGGSAAARQSRLLGGTKSLPRAVAAMRGASTGSERQPGQSFAEATAPCIKLPLCVLS